MKSSFHQVLQSFTTGFRVANTNLIYIVPFLVDAIIRNAYRRTPYRELPAPALSLILLLIFMLMMLSYQFMLPYFIQTNERNIALILKKSARSIQRLLPFLAIFILGVFGLFFLRFLSHVVLFRSAQEFDEVMRYLSIMDTISIMIARIISILSLLFVFITIFFSIEGLGPVSSAKKSFWFSLKNIHFILVIGVIILIQYGLMRKVVQLSGLHTAIQLGVRLLSEYFHYWILMSCLSFYQMQIPKDTPHSLR